jgi:hypothetical protein
LPSRCPPPSYSCIRRVPLIHRSARAMNRSHWSKISCCGSTSMSAVLVQDPHHRLPRRLAARIQKWDDRPQPPYSAAPLPSRRPEIVDAAVPQPQCAVAHDHQIEHPEVTGGCEECFRRCRQPKTVNQRDGHLVRMPADQQLGSYRDRRPLHSRDEDRLWHLLGQPPAELPGRREVSEGCSGGKHASTGPHNSWVGSRPPAVKVAPTQQLRAGIWE